MITHFERIKLDKTNSKIKKSNLSGLILCGGAARRIGGEDKGLIKAKTGQNMPLIEHQLAFLKPQVSALAISANRNLDTYQAYGFPVYQDETYQDNKVAKFDGPLQGILNGLKNCQTDWLYVQPIDTPNLPFDAIEQLIGNIKTSSATAFYLISDERQHYLHLLLHISCYESLNRFVSRGERRVKAYLDEVGAQAVNLGWSEDVFKNLNNVEDYQLPA
jgi:molybdopterin-guanine dinucleotide biosynthesis protein A